MIGKVNTTSKSLAARNKKDTSDVNAKQQTQKSSNKKLKSSAPNDVVVIDNRGTTIEVTVKTKGRKSGSAMVSSPSNAPNSLEDKMLNSNVTESRANNWSRTLREQNRPALKQGLQQLAGQMQSTKHTRRENHERKEIRTIMETHQSHKYIRQDSRIFDEIPVKQAARKSSEQIKALSNSAVPSTTTIASSLESIEVTDRGVQCGGIFDCSNDRLGIYNPVRVLGILMQEMEGLVRDERSSKILTEMEQALLRIPREQGKLPPDVLEKIALCTKLEAGMSQLENTSKELEAASAKLRKDKESLQQQVTKQSILLEECIQRERNAEMTIKKLKMDLNESTRVAADNRKVIGQLRQDTKSMEVTQKLARDLRRDLNEQIELSEQRYMEIQYLKLEKDKLLALSSYKDVTLNELRNKLKDLQNQISEQLINIREAGTQEMSMIHGGLACSSPTSTSSKNSLGPRSCPELSEISLATVDCFRNPAARMDNAFDGGSENSDNKIIEDKTHSEFISLPGEETSHTLSLTHPREEETRPAVSTADNKNERSTTIHREWKLEEFRSAPNFERTEADLANRVEKEGKEHRSKSKPRKASSNIDNRQIHPDDDDKCPSSHEEDQKFQVKLCSGDPASIKKQFAIMFDDIRRQSKFLVNVQSPPRSYPRADWTDTSLQTISGISGSNVA